MWADTIRASGRRFASRPALVAEKGWPVSFASPDRLTDEVAVGLARRGVSHGEVVALLVPAQFAAGTTLHVIDRWSATAVLDAVSLYPMTPMSKIDRIALEDAQIGTVPDRESSKSG